MHNFLRWFLVILVIIALALLSSQFVPNSASGAADPITYCNPVVLFPDGTRGDLNRLHAEGWGPSTQCYKAAYAPGQEHWELSLVQIRVDGITNLDVYTADQNGMPIPGQPVTYSYPNLESPSRDLPLLPEWSASKWTTRGVTNKWTTDGSGKASFQQGDGVWCKQGFCPLTSFVVSKAPSDAWVYFGWKGGTEHHGPMILFFRLMPGSASPTPTFTPTRSPTPGGPTTTPVPPLDLSGVIAALDRINDTLREAYRLPTATPIP